MKPPRLDPQNIATRDQVKLKSRESGVLSQFSVASKGVAEEEEDT